VLVRLHSSSNSSLCITLDISHHPDDVLRFETSPCQAQRSLCNPRGLLYLNYAWSLHFVWWRSEEMSFWCRTPNHSSQGRTIPANKCYALWPDVIHTLAFVTWIRGPSIFGSPSLLDSTSTLISESEARLETRVYFEVNISISHILGTQEPKSLTVLRP
jgi:hypothetical protein